MLDVTQIISKYYKDNPALHALLLEHSMQVADFAVDIALKERLLLDKDVDIKFVYDAAMLHDIGVFLCHAPEIYCYGTHHYLEHGYLGAELLRKEGLEKHALVCERHIGVGLSKETIIENKLPLPHKDMIPISLEEKIIAYADLFFSKSSVDIKSTPEKIRQKLAKYGDENVKVFDTWHEMFDR